MTAATTTKIAAASLVPGDFIISRIGIPRKIIAVWGNVEIEFADGSTQGIHPDHTVTIIATEARAICDGLGHGYPGGGPCPLEDRW